MALLFAYTVLLWSVPLLSYNMNLIVSSRYLPSALGVDSMMFSEKLYLHGISPIFLMKNVYLKKFKFLIVPSSLYAVAPKFRSVASVSILSSPMFLKLLYVYSWNSGNDSVFKNDVGTVNASSRESVSSTFPVSSDTLNVPTNRP